MSLNGFHTFEQNLRKIMKTKAFKNADLPQRTEIGHRLLNSKYGIGLFNKVTLLPDPTPKEIKEPKNKQNQ